MKRILALILTVLMVAGSMAFAASAVAADGYVYLLDSVKNGALDVQAKLDAPIAKAPVLDGEVDAGEYSATWTTDSTNAAEYQNYGVALSETEKIVEYAAYDSNWLYLAVEITLDGYGTDYLGNEVYFRLATGIATLHTTGQMGTMCANGSWQTSNTIQSYYGVNGNDVYTHGPANDVVDNLSNAGKDATQGSHAITDKDVMDVVWNSDKTVVEAKFSRRYFQTYNGLYGYELRICPKWDAATLGDGQYNRVYLSNKLSETEKAELGVTNSYSPRMIWLSNETTATDRYMAQANTKMVLNTPVVTAPVQDGEIGATEYTTSRAVVAGDVIISNGGTYTEYFAYDADWVYYAIKADTGVIGTRPTFMIDPDFSLEGKTSDDTYYTKNGDSIGWGFLASEVSMQFRLADSYAKANADKPGWNAYHYITQHGASVRRVMNAWAVMGVADAEGNKLTSDINLDTNTDSGADATAKTVMEIKFSRNNWKSENNTYAYQVLAYGDSSDKPDGIVGGGDAMLLANKLGTYEGKIFTAGYLPRLIAIEDEDIITKSTASVRISTTNAGLRFKTNISNALVDSLEAQGYDLEVGTLIAPTDTIGTTIAALDHSSVVVGTNCIDVVADIDQAFDEGSLYNTYAGSIVGIKEENKARDFSARGYIKATKGEEVKYFYSDVVASRSISAVATAADKDCINMIGTAPSASYPYLIDEENGIYSPYTVEQLAIIRKLK